MFTEPKTGSAKKRKASKQISQPPNKKLRPAELTNGDVKLQKPKKKATKGEDGL